MRHSKVNALLPVAVACLGCGEHVQREYVYTRQEPAMGRRSPTTFVVRLSIDPASKTVVWAEDVHDSDGELGREMKTLQGCTFLDESNWECEPLLGPNYEVLVQVEMRDGQLHQKYWTEDRKFRVRRRIGRVTF
jgi:hypothetical protein